MSTNTYARFEISQRIEHILALTSFVILAVTGLPQKYSAAGWAQGLVEAKRRGDAARRPYGPMEHCVDVRPDLWM